MVAVKDVQRLGDCLQEIFHQGRAAPDVSFADPLGCEGASAYSLAFIQRKGRAEDPRGRLVTKGRL